MKKYLILICLVSLGYLHSKACSWYSEDEAFFNLFNQELIADKNLMPFLLTYDNIYYKEDYWSPGMRSLDTINTDYNILEWKKYFDNQISEADLHYLVYDSKVNELSRILSSQSVLKENKKLQHSELLNPKGIEALKYLLFAKTCEPYAVKINREDNEWQYIETRTKLPKATFMSIAKEGNQLYASTQNTSIKLRIAYQLVRLSHYGGFNDDAVRYFKTYVEPLNDKSLLYYYAMEQKAGALYNQKKFDLAAYDYIRVFANTPDRKLAAYTSFAISDQMNFNKALALCKTPEEKATIYLLRGYDNFANQLTEMKNVYAVSPNSSALELLAVRELNKLERSILELPQQYATKQTFLNPSATLKTNLQNDILFAEKILKENKLKRTAFWQVYLAHLYFMSGNYAKAQSIAEVVKSDEELILEQKNRTAFSAYLAQQKTIDQHVENEVYKRFVNNKDEFEQKYIWEVMGHKYLAQKNYAKAFLCHNDLSGLYTSLDVKIIDDLMSFVQQQNKNDIENYLLEKISKNGSPMTALNELKGSYYFKTDDLENAEKWYEKVPENYAFLKLHEWDYDKNIAIEKEGKFNGYSNIPGKIFSTGIQPYFDIPVDKAMTDKTYKSFDFIKENMTKKEVVKALIELKKITAGSDEKSAKANFLLGNFYYNTSPGGYFRNVMYYEPDNYYLSYIYSYEETTKLPLKTPYNYDGGTGLFFYNNVVKPKSYYLAAEKISGDNELKAKSVFGASKCELDINYAGANYDFWSNYKLLYSPTTRPLFTKLKTNYSNTAFFKEAKSNCLYFEYYLAGK